MIAEPVLSRAAAIPRDVEITLCRLDDDRDIALADAARWLSSQEEARARRLRFDEDRDRFIRGRGFLRRSLAQRLGGEPNAIDIRTAPGGKPHLGGNELSFNLSHSGGLAALATSTDHELGLDIERLAPHPALVRNPKAIINACFNAEESAAIISSPIPTLTFLQFWTAKEARMKLTGEGMALDPRSITLSHQDGRPVSYVAPVRPAAALFLLDFCGAVGALAIRQRVMH
jgi:4'-phosphopantetheinyl transferase